MSFHWSSVPWGKIIGGALVAVLGSGNAVQLRANRVASQERVQFERSVGFVEETAKRYMDQSMAHLAERDDCRTQLSELRVVLATLQEEGGR